MNSMHVIFHLNNFKRLIWHVNDSDKQNLPMLLKLCKSSQLGVIGIATYWAPGFWADRDSGLGGAGVCADEEGRAGRGR